MTEHPAGESEDDVPESAGAGDEQDLVDPGESPWEDPQGSEIEEGENQPQDCSETGGD